MTGSMQIDSNNCERRKRLPKRRLRILQILKRHKAAFQVMSIVVTLLISFASLAISFQANKYAMLQGRPYVTLEVIPVNNRFLSATKKDNSCFVGYSLKMKNEGNTPAINILFPDSAGVGKDDHGETIRRKFAAAPQPIALAAGEEYTGVMGLIIPVDGVNTNIDERVNQGDITIGIDLVIEYEGLTSRGKKYHTGIGCKISATKLQPIGQALH